MFIIPTFLAPSTIHGQGVHTSVDLTDDQLIWQFVVGFDLSWTTEEFVRLPDLAQQFIFVYGYWYAPDLEIYIGGDFDRFYNHSAEANTFVDPKGVVRCCRGVSAGSELTINYREFNLFSPFQLGEISMTELSARIRLQSGATA
jgi:hypothetical protein